MLNTESRLLPSLEDGARVSRNSSFLLEVKFPFSVSVWVVLLRFSPQCFLVHLTRIQAGNDIPIVVSQVVTYQVFTYLSSASTSKPGTQSMSA